MHLYIIGRNPSDKLLSYSTSPTIHFTGAVENVWDYIRSADAFVFPMQSGAGLQNKVLEAMYAGKPVITSTIGNEGIGAKHGRELYIANDIVEYVDAIEDSVEQGSMIGSNAREYVQVHYSSRSLYNSFKKLLLN
jgi:glycosyltransferase involved in cell wall biosynthesis